MQDPLVWAALQAPGFDVDAFVHGLQVTPDRRAQIASFEQRSPEWFLERFGRATSSNFGAAVGHYTPSAQQKVLTNMLWPEQASLQGKAAAFAEWGTTMETVARDLYVNYRRKTLGPDLGPLLQVTETGLLVSLDEGWLAASPDFVVDEPVPIGSGDDDVIPGAAAAPPTPTPEPTNVYHARAPYIIDHVVEAALFKRDPERDPEPGLEPEPASEAPTIPGIKMVRGCGEIKCPASKTLYSVTGKHDEHQFPRHYYDQITGTMAINGWPWCDTVVYTPLKTEVIRFYFNSKYWLEELLPALRAFYFHTFLPRLKLRVQGRLRPGETDPVLAPAKPLALPMVGRKRARRPVHTAEASDPCPKTTTPPPPPPPPPKKRTMDDMVYACVQPL